MRNINQEKLNKILKEHELWVKGKGGKRANLRCANLENADLEYVNLKYADLKYANLSNTDLSNTDLRYTNLRCVDLRYTDLSYSNLSNADLSNANLSNANLSSANLKDIKTNIHTIGYNLACPEEGSFIGYKKASGCLIELLILEDAKRSSATTAKCRCNKAKVLDIRDIKTGKKVKEIRSNYDSNFIYKVGEIIHVDNFDNNRWNECSTGIHFFVNKENAINY